MKGTRLGNKDLQRLPICFQCSERSIPGTPNLVQSRISSWQPMTQAPETDSTNPLQVRPMGTGRGSSQLRPSLAEKLPAIKSPKPARYRLKVEVSVIGLVIPEWRMIESGRNSLIKVLRVLCIFFASVVLLNGCGGDSGTALDTSEPVVGSGAVNTGAGKPEVNSVTLDRVSYRQPVMITIVGTDLDSGITVSANCGTLERSVTAPFVSSATTAYYQCTPGFIGQGWLGIVRDSDSVTLYTSTYDMPPPEVTLEVSNGAGVSGNIVIQLRPDRKPGTVNNFLSYVKSGYYVGTILDYVFLGFNIQGGGYLPFVPPSSPVRKLPNNTIGDENDRWNQLESTTWTVSTASEYFSRDVSSMFTINLSTFPTGVTPFGKVTSGQDVLMAVTQAPCMTIPHRPAPACLPVPNVVVIAVAQTK